MKLFINQIVYKLNLYNYTIIKIFMCVGTARNARHTERLTSKCPCGNSLMYSLFN